MAKKRKTTRKPKATVANAPPLPDFEEIDAATPATPEALGEEQPSEASAALRALLTEGVPTDHYQAAEWAYRAQIASMADAIADPKISSASRRREIRQCGAAAAALFPRAEEYKVRELIVADRRERDERESQRGGAKLEPVKPAVPKKGHVPPSGDAS